MRVVSMRLPGHGRVRFEGDETIAFLSGEVPRLVIRDGSDAFDIWEGQCLPIEGPSVYIQNPYQRDVVVNIGVDMAASYGVNDLSDFTGRHYQKTTWLMQAGAFAADGARRVGVGILPDKGRYEVMAQFSGVTDLRTTLVAGADPAFMAAKPAGALEGTGQARDILGPWANGMMEVSGYFTDADITAWVTSSGFTGQLRTYSYDNLTRELRWTLDRTTALIVSVAPGSTIKGHLLIRELGLDAEEFD